MNESSNIVRFEYERVPYVSFRVLARTVIRALAIPSVMLPAFDSTRCPFLFALLYLIEVCRKAYYYGSIHVRYGTLEL